MNIFERAAMIERAKEFALSEARVSATVAEDMADYALEEIERYKIALADAIRRPMGVVPESAEGLVDARDIDRAETRRMAKVNETA